MALPALRRPKVALRDFDEAIDLDPSSPAVPMPMSAAVWRVHRSVSSRSRRRRVGSGSLGKPTDETLYSAARIHGQAAAAATGEVKKTGQAAAALASRYQDQALELLRQTIAALPAAHARVSCAMLFRPTRAGGHPPSPSESGSGRTSSFLSRKHGAST